MKRNKYYDEGNTRYYRNGPKESFLEEVMSTMSLERQ